MSLFLLLAAQSAFTVTNAVYKGPLKRPANARMVWHDEFNGTALDRRKWKYDTARNKQGWFNGELQYYSAGLGRAGIYVGTAALGGAGLDLRLLRGASEAAVRARHLARNLDASGRHEDMAGRRRDRHHGAGGR